MVNDNPKADIDKAVEEIMDDSRIVNLVPPDTEAHTNYQLGKANGYANGYRDAVKARPVEWLADHDRKLFIEITGWLRFQDETEQIPTWSDQKHGEILADRFFKGRE